MLEINIKWFLVLLANFIILLIALNKILFQPMLRLFKEREENTKGALDISKEMIRKKDDAVAKLNKEIADARGKAKEAFEFLMTEGINSQKDVFSKAKTEASEILLKSRDELRAEAEKARQKLRADVDKFSDEIVRKLITA